MVDATPPITDINVFIRLAISGDRLDRLPLAQRVLLRLNEATIPIIKLFIPLITSFFVVEVKILRRVICSMDLGDGNRCINQLLGRFIYHLLC